MTSEIETSSGWRVETRTRLSGTFAILGLLVFALLATAPFLASRSVVQNLFFILTMLTLAQNWNLLAGYAGLISVGQQLFVGCGAYALFGLVILAGVDPILAVPLAGVFAMLVALPTAFFVFRLYGPYFAIGTWVVAEVGRLLLAQWKALGGGTGTSLPRDAMRDMLGLSVLQDWFGMRASVAVDALTYWLALALAFVTIVFVYKLLRSKQGLGLAAVRDNETAARALGVDARRLKTVVYLLTAFLTGIAGALVYLQKARISPDAAFSLTDWTAYVVFIVVIGGIGTIEGPIIGLIVFFLLQNRFSSYGSWYLLALGALAILTMLFAPRGLWGLISSRTGWELFPVRRLLRGGPIRQTEKGGPHG
ncbi:branched-chain amino acid ABC transporter permease [Agrobacterium vitis]|uniref:Branched-chain amino acid ABC transporter permease n=2 Tax=Agrobacterium vitis TaxID=373 RepID=A0AAE4X054_AGRVI|nr:branched-chain amino acid ABC transporter permease [Agrobacterium vitis]MUO81493.1 branched-chain amino acid ABC transporter permease [Agrobacterium vitis]MUO95860.1 branched-chain amino acid ABC transporter permease [Agrobacterium vitis]MVA93939.1 branched-chain amino acid ABC transporter permease [Agrobacterium vitis]MVB03554.1 branched-chain amino acid ABC transporter permease [Agrobacterium vitis]